VRRLLILLAAVAMLVAGCGGGGSGSSAPSGPPLTKQAYQDKLKSISTEVGKSVGQTSSSGKIEQKNVDKLVSAFHTFADRLREVNPPTDVKQLHEQLITAFDDLADEFPDIAKKVNSAQDASAGLAAFLGAKSTQKLIKLGQEFKAEGYDLDLNGP
jgi:hypothetical protein